MQHSQSTHRQHDPDETIAKTSVVSLRHVAEHAGVSIRTVSCVLNGAENARIAEATQRRVRESAAALGYRANSLGRSLRRKQTDIVGFYVGGGYADTHDPFMSEAVNGMQAGCDEHQQNLLFYGKSVPDTARKAYNQLSNGFMDGLVMLPSSDDELMRLLRESPLPIILLAGADPILPSVHVNEVGAAHEIIQHLAERGHTRVFYLAEPKDSPPGHYLKSDRRFRAYLLAAEAAGLDLIPIHAANYHGELPDEQKRQIATRTPECPTALICWNDVYACAAMRFCEEQGLRVPEDLAVVGFDGAYSPLPTRYQLTTVMAPWKEAAKTAVALVNARLRVEAVPALTLLPAEIRIGETT